VVASLRQPKKKTMALPLVVCRAHVKAGPRGRWQLALEVLETREAEACAAGTPGKISRTTTMADANRNATA